jgi:hypothetical protein
VYQVRASLGLPAQPEGGTDLDQVPADLDQTFSSVLQAEAQLIQSAAELGVVHSYQQTPKQLLEDFEKQGDIDRTFARLAANAPAVNWPAADGGGELLDVTNESRQQPGPSGLARGPVGRRAFDMLCARECGGLPLPPTALRGAAIGLLSLLRNEGGSVGTSMAQTFQERRLQFHGLRLGESLDLSTRRCTPSLIRLGRFSCSRPAIPLRRSSWRGRRSRICGSSRHPRSLISTSFRCWPR